MINIDEAQTIAESILDERVRPWVHEPVAIAVESTRVAEDNIVFFYDTVAYLETGSVSHALAGNGPIIVDRVTATARIASSSRPWDEQLDD